MATPPNAFIRAAFSDDAALSVSMKVSSPSLPPSLNASCAVVTVKISLRSACVKVSVPPAGLVPPLKSAAVVSPAVKPQSTSMLPVNAPPPVSSTVKVVAVAVPSAMVVGAVAAKSTP